MPNNRPVPAPAPVPVLIATRISQGMRASDFCWTEEGELVTFSSACESDNDEIDGQCGCQRSMAGLSSKKATTTFKVAILPDGEQKLREALTRYWQDIGWVAPVFSQQEQQHIIEQDVHELLRLASDFPVGTILEIRGDIIQNREPAAQRGKQ